MIIDSTNSFEADLHVFVAEASDLQLSPSVIDWPKAFKTTLGNKLAFRMTVRSPEYCKYQQQFGCITLKVFND